jgi:hypothetical protein
VVSEATSRETALEVALAPDPEIAEEDHPDLAQALTQEAPLVVAEDITEEATLLSVTEMEAVAATEVELLRPARPAIAVADLAATAEDLIQDHLAMREDPSLPESELPRRLSKAAQRFPPLSRESMQRKMSLEQIDLLEISSRDPSCSCCFMKRQIDAFSLTLFT